MLDGVLELSMYSRDALGRAAKAFAARICVNLAMNGKFRAIRLNIPRWPISVLPIKQSILIFLARSRSPQSPRLLPPWPRSLLWLWQRQAPVLVCQHSSPLPVIQPPPVPLITPRSTYTLPTSAFKLAGMTVSAESEEEEDEGSALEAVP
jgi:hypothetical protein